MVRVRVTPDFISCFVLSWLGLSCNLLMKWRKVKKKDRCALISDCPNLCISEVSLSLCFCQVVSHCLPHIMRKQSVFTVFVLVQDRGGAEGSFEWNPTFERKVRIGRGYTKAHYFMYVSIFVSVILLCPCLLAKKWAQQNQRRPWSVAERKCLPQRTA